FTLYYKYYLTSLIINLIAIESRLASLDSCNKIFGLVRLDNCCLKVSPFTPGWWKSIQKIKGFFTSFNFLFRFYEALNKMFDLINIFCRSSLSLKSTVQN